MSPAADSAHHASSIRHEAEAEAARYPALLAESGRIAATVAQGVHGRRRKGQGETFWEYRRHYQTDPASRIDWRRSARSDDLFVRENEWEAANSVWLWRDGSDTMNWRSQKTLPAKRDRAAVLTIALASLLIRGGERCAVLGEGEAPRAGSAGLDRAASLLADGKGEGETLMTAPLARHGRVILASDFLEPPEIWRARLARFAAVPAGGALLMIADPAEETFPFEGRTLFKAPGGGREILVGRAETVGETYRRRYTAHREEILQTARRAGWPVVTHRTDAPPARALLSLYRALDRDER